MNEENKYSLTAAQSKFARTTNHRVWDLMEKSNRTALESEEMVLAANTSLYHWLQVGTAVHAQHGHWLLSRVYLVLDRPRDAVEHAQRCLRITENNPDEMKDFDLAYAREALARAYALAGDLDLAKKYYDMAVELGDKIKDPEDRQIFVNDLQGGEWFQFSLK